MLMLFNILNIKGKIISYLNYFSEVYLVINCIENKIF